MSEIIVKLGLQKANFQRDVKAAQKEIKGLEAAGKKGESTMRHVFSALSGFIPMMGITAVTKGLIDVAIEAKEANYQLDKALRQPRHGANASIEALNAQLAASKQRSREFAEENRKLMTEVKDWGTKFINEGSNGINWWLGIGGKPFDDVKKRKDLQKKNQAQSVEDEANVVAKQSELEAEQALRHGTSGTAAQLASIRRRMKESIDSNNANKDLSQDSRDKLNQLRMRQAQREEEILSRKIVLEDRERLAQVAIAKLRGTEGEKRIKQLQIEIQLLKARANATGDGDEKKKLSGDIAMKQNDLNEAELSEFSKSPEQRRAEKQQAKQEAQQRRIAEQKRKTKQEEQARKQALKDWDEGFNERRPKGISPGKQWDEKDGEPRVAKPKAPSADPSSVNRTDAAVSETNSGAARIVEAINTTNDHLVKLFNNR